MLFPRLAAGLPRGHLKAPDTSQKGQFGDHKGKGFGLRSSTQ